MQGRRLAGFVAAAAVSMGLAGAVQAGGTIVTRDGRQIIKAPSGQGAYDDGTLRLYAGANQHVVLMKNIHDSAALHANHTTHPIAPDAQYLHTRPGRIDHNHSLLRAQRLHADLHTLATRVIRRTFEHTTPRQDAHRAGPVMILHKPDALRQRENQGDAPHGIPSVPRLEKPASETDGERMARRAE